MSELMVTKRSGEVVDFDASRIRTAIQKATIAAKHKIADDLLDKIVSDICREIEDRFKDFYPNVENIQDIVEKHLVTNNLYEVSKGYILYRAERQQAREQRIEEGLKKLRLGRLKVKKRNGTIAIFDLTKIRNTLTRACKDQDVSVDLILKEVVKNIYDGVSTEDIGRAMVLAAVAFIEKDPAYTTVSSRLFLQNIYKEVIGESITESMLENSYRSTFKNNVKKAVDDGLLDQRMMGFDLEKLASGLKIDRDGLMQFMGLQTLYERYFLKDENGRLELPQIFWMRVAMGLAIMEEDKTNKALEFYDVMSSLRYVPSTPTLFHSGTAHPQLASCYLTTINDDLAHIFKCLGDNAQLSKWSGGLGNDWSFIRATGARIKSTGVESQGVIPFLKIANDVTAAINRSGKRRGATCAYLETWHADIEDFLDLRRNTGDDRRRAHDMNTANWIPDLFIKRVLTDEQWTLFSPDEVPELHDLSGKTFELKYKEYEQKALKGDIHVYKRMPAKKLWRKMLTRLFETGHPWITFKDPCNIRSPQDHAGVIHSSNLCTEITLNTSADETAVCNLGSVNLAMHMNDGKINEMLLGQTVRTAMRMLDNVIDINFYPTPETKNSNMRHRPVGLGIMGLQDALFSSGIDFTSEEAVRFIDGVTEFVSFHAILTSSKIAKERGAYGSFKGSKWDRGIFPVDTLDLLEEERGMEIEVPRTSSMDWTPVREHVKQHGMRNSNTMAIAPNATISTIAGCFPSIEPIYKNIYVKSNMTGEFTIVNSFLVNDLKKLNLWNQEMLDQIKYYDGNLQMITALPDWVKARYKESFDIDQEVLIKLAAIRGKWIDQSQSLNIFMKGTSGKKLNDVYIAAWKMGLKTTYYLRSLAATQIEKSTLDASKFGFTQKREYKQVESAPLCKIEDPECEACQ